jgi:hypothetical protein
MAEVDLPARVLAELDPDKSVIPVVGRSPIRWEFWMSFAAALAVIFVFASGLLIMIAELHAGWVPGHQLPMDKATAIHNLLFRS